MALEITVKLQCNYITAEITQAATSGSSRCLTPIHPLTYPPPYRPAGLSAGYRPLLDSAGATLLALEHRAHRGNTGQVVAELKVVTSNKLCEPIL